MATVRACPRTRRCRSLGHAPTARDAGPRENNHNWKALLGHPECYRNTPFGPVANYDGELIVDNPRFVKPRAFSMADKTLRLDDLY